MPTTCSVNLITRDTFGSGALVPLISRAADIGGTWASIGGGGLQSQNNRVFSTVAAASYVKSATAITGNTRVVRGEIVNTNSSSNGSDSALIGIINDSNSGYYYGFEGNNLVVKKMVSGVLSTLGTQSFTAYTGVKWQLTMHISFAAANPVITCFMFDGVAFTITDSTSPITTCNKASLYANGVHTLADSYQFVYINGQDALDFVAVVGDDNALNAASGSDLTARLDVAYQNVAIVTSNVGGNTTLATVQSNQIGGFEPKLVAQFNKKRIIVVAGTFDIANATDQANAGNTAFSAFIAVAAYARQIGFNEVYGYKIPTLVGPTSGSYLNKFGANFISGKNTYNTLLGTSNNTNITGAIDVPPVLATASNTYYVLGPNSELVFLNAAGIQQLASAIVQKAATCVTTGTGTGTYTQADLDAAVAQATINARIGYISQSAADAAVAQAITNARVGYVTSAFAEGRYQAGYSAGVAATPKTTVITDLATQLKNADAVGYARGYLDGKNNRRRV